MRSLSASAQQTPLSLAACRTVPDRIWAHTKATLSRDQPPGSISGYLTEHRYSSRTGGCRSALHLRQVWRWRSPENSNKRYQKPGRVSITCQCGQIPRLPAPRCPSGTCRGKTSLLTHRPGWQRCRGMPAANSPNPRRTAPQVRSSSPSYDIDSDARIDGPMTRVGGIFLCIQHRDLRKM